MVPIIWASPNKDGLTAACAKAAQSGILATRTEARLFQLNSMDIAACRVCGNGWGKCRAEHECVVEDDFAQLKKDIVNAEMLVLVTPVYWGEESEVLKNFLDKLRRCIALMPEKPLAEKKIVLIAVAGGSGNGTISCLEEMERWAKHVQMKVFDAIMVTRFNKDYKLEQIAQACNAAV